MKPSNVNVVARMAAVGSSARKGRVVCGVEGDQKIEGEQGQALVETAIVMPLVVFLILGLIQLTMLQHAKIMTEFAAYSAARTGIVWNADRFRMENAALIALLPTNENLERERAINDPMQAARQVIQRGLLYQLHNRLPQALGLLRKGAGNLLKSKTEQASTGYIDKAVGRVKGEVLAGTNLMIDQAQGMLETMATGMIAQALGSNEDRLVRVDIVSPSGGGVIPGLSDPTTIMERSGLAQVLAAVKGGGLQSGDPMVTAMVALQAMSVLKSVWSKGLAQFLVNPIAGDFQAASELDFDSYEKVAPPLSIRVRYLYLMRVPFANWVIHGAWMALKAGQRLYGQIWNPQLNPQATGLGSDPNDFYIRAKLLHYQNRDVDVAARLAEMGTYVLPIYASYSMRMQSNPYRSSVQQQ